MDGPRHYWLLALAFVGIALPPVAILIGNIQPEISYISVLLLETILLVLFAVMLFMVSGKWRRVSLTVFALPMFLVHGYLIIRMSSSVQLYKTHMYLLLAQVPLLLYLGIHACSWPFRAILGNLYLKHKKKIDAATVFSLILFNGLLFLWNPVSLHLTDLNSMPFPFLTLLSRHVVYFVAAFAITFAVYRLSFYLLRPVLLCIFLTMAIAAWVYTYLLPGDYGVLDATILSKPGHLRVFNQGVNSEYLKLFALEFAGLLLLFSLSLVGIFRFPRWLLPVVVILNLMTSGQTLFDLGTSDDLLKAGHSDNDEAFLPESSKPAFRFSNQGNIIVFMLDMFGADLIPAILEQYPDIQDSLKGFTWYPSTLSTGFSTYGSLPSILAGPEYTPDRVNASNGTLLEERIHNAYTYYPTISHERGYDFTFVHPDYLSLDEYINDERVTVANPRHYVEYWLSISKEAANLDFDMSPEQYVRLFSVIGFFKASPHFVRPFIYLDGRWLLTRQSYQDVKHAVIHLGFIDLLDSLSYADGGLPTFKFITNELPHTPWAIGSDLKLESSRIGDYIFDPQYEIEVANPDAVYFSAVRTMKEIASFTKWLEDENLIDVTKIVIVSDHGYSGIHRQWTKLPVLRDEVGNIITGSSRVNSLLLVKGYNSKSRFSVDNRLMSIADVPSIALSRLDDPTLGTAEDREIVVNFTSVHPRDNGPYKYRINHQFVVSGDPAESENWRYIRQ